MSIPPQTVYGFLGPNGSGKTTAIRMMCGLLQPTAGKIEVLGMNIPEQTEQIRRQVGYMTQKFSMYGDLSVYQNMRFMARIMGVYGRGMEQRIAHLLERFKLDTFSRRSAGSLSGGQKRRLALAASVIHKPKLLLLDEPTSEVDPNTRREFWDELFVMCEAGTTILVTTHLMDEAERCHHLAIINEGCKVADGTPTDLKSGIGADICQVQGPDISELRSVFSGEKRILATARIGMAIRVITEKGVEPGCQWLSTFLADYQVSVEPAEPSIEDVFVMATRDNRGAEQG
ncbi:MAG: ABC transporter ATP-binding protein [Desulfobulbaceae bacterium]|nr:MAG: ABC transporter ATP-binding protein [Desulfobulbaceae bacterium]